MLNYNSTHMSVIHPVINCKNWKWSIWNKWLRILIGNLDCKLQRNIVLLNLARPPTCTQTCMTLLGKNLESLTELKWSQLVIHSHQSQTVCPAWAISEASEPSGTITMLPNHDACVSRINWGHLVVPGSINHMNIDTLSRRKLNNFFLACWQMGRCVNYYRIHYLIPELKAGAEP